MNEFEKNRSTYENSWRGTYLIIPIKVCEKQKVNLSDWNHVLFDEMEELSDKSDLLKRRCKSVYVNKYLPRNEEQMIQIHGSEKIKFLNQQIYLFENGIGFLTLFLFCSNGGDSFHL